MAFDKYKDSAWQEIEDSVRKYESSAWEDCEFVRREESSAWIDIWPTALGMEEYRNTLKSLTKTSANYSEQEEYSHKAWNVTSQNISTGMVQYYAEGEFVNPTITIDCELLLSYISTSTHYVNGSVGYLYTKSGSTSIGVGTLVSFDVATGDSAKVTKKLTGTFTRIGLSITFPDLYGRADDGASINHLFTLKEFTIDGEVCIPSKNCVFSS